MTTQEEAASLADALDNLWPPTKKAADIVQEAADLLRQWPEAGEPGPLTLTQATAPREIWLQVSDSTGDSAEAFPDDTEGVTWCAESALLNEVRYVRADLAAPSQQPAPAQSGMVPNDAALNALAKMFHSGEEIEGDDGAAMMVDMALWHEASEAFDSLIGEGEGETLASSAPAVREPLTDEQIASIVYEMNGNEPTAPFWRDLARAIEAHHGIGGGGK